MTPNEIKAIARAYAETTLNEYSNGVDKDNAKALIPDLESFLQWLSDTHCIAPKSKVVQEYRNCMSLAQNHPKPSERTIAKCAADELKAVFGANTFNEQ